MGQQNFRSIFAQRTRQELVLRFRGIDVNIIDQWLAAGLDRDTLPALQIAPLALMAWASGSVSDVEAQRAIRAISDSELAGNAPATAKFRSWLQREPTDDLMPLWKELVLADRSMLSREEWIDNGRLLVQHAYAIAMASGGEAQVGHVCEAEQRLLDRIREVFTNG